MGNIQHTSYCFSFVDVTFRVLHMLGVLRWSYNAQKLFCIIPRNFGVWFFGKIQHPGARLQLLTSAWWFEMIWSRLARKWHIKVGIEPNATIGQLVKTRMLIGCGTTKPLVNTPQKVPHTTYAVAANLMSASLSHMHSHNTRSLFLFLQRNIFWASGTAE